MLDSSSISLSALTITLPHPCFGLILYGLSLFHFSFEERARLLQPLRRPLLKRYSQIAGGMSYQLMPGFILGLHDLCTFRNGWTTGWTKGRKNSTTSSQIRTDCSQLNESLTHAPVTGSEQRYLKGDYQRPHSVPVRLYSLCPGISKQARQGLFLDNMGRNKPDRCYLFHLWPFYPNSDFHPARDFKHVCLCLPFSVTLKA